jgi:hypothetical protein
MLELIITETGEATGAPSDTALRQPEIWRDEDGVVFARGYQWGGTHWMELPEVGTFWFGSKHAGIVAAPEPAVPRELVFDAYRRLVLPNALQALGREVLHASAVLGPKGVIALCARRKTGKSTTAYALSRRGYRLWADDAVALEITGGSVMSPRLPFALRLRPASASFFRSDGPNAAASSNAPEPAELAPLAVVFVLERAGVAGEAAVEVLPLVPHEAFIALLGNAYWFSLADEQRKRRMMSRYLELSALVSVFRLRFRPEFENLDTILDRLEQELRRLETPL